MNIQQAIINLQVASTPEEKISWLRDIINKADKAYYLNDKSLLADVIYDQYFKELVALEDRFPTHKTPDSPTQRIGGGVSEQLGSVSHIVPMLSLENSYNSDDLIEWDRRNRETLGAMKITYTVEPKYDGASISIIYDQNLLSRGATRGDGVHGEDITNNVRQIKSVPLSINALSDDITSIEIRGEVVIKKKTFEKLNEERAKEGLSVFANPRNAASGSLRMLDSNEVKKRGLFAILYHISHITTTSDESDHPLHVATHYEAIEWLDRQGMATPIDHITVCDGIDQVIEACQRLESIRDTLPYELDGAVVKVNLFAHQDTLGMTSHHPRWAMAYKFKARQATTKLSSVEYQVGRTGIITPVAKVDPVHIGGVTVSSISLFNEDILKEKDLMIGDTVIVERAGDVIPYIVQSIATDRTGTELAITFPSRCPVCDDALVKEIEEVAWRCINASCSAQVLEKMIHFASKQAMDINSLGSSIITRFYELGLLEDIVGIYTLDYETIRRLDKFGEKSVERLKEAIESSKQQPMHRLIFGLGIRFVGERTAKTLASAVQDHILELEQWSIESLCTLEDIGIKVATSVYSFFQNEDNIKMLKGLEEYGVNLNKPKQTSVSNSEGRFVGKSFLFTGTLSSFKRSDAESLVEKEGGKILGSVSSKLDYLVVGTDAGSKLEKAKKLGSVIILSELQFKELII